MGNDRGSSSKNKGISPVVAGVVGAAVGAAVGIAAVELSDEKNRKTVKQKLGEIQKEGEKVYTSLKNTAIGEKSKR